MVYSQKQIQLRMFSDGVFLHEQILQTVVLWRQLLDTMTSLLQQGSLLQMYFLSVFKTRFVLGQIWHKKGNVVFFTLHTCGHTWPEVKIAKKKEVIDIDCSNGVKFARNQTWKVASIYVHPAQEECSCTAQSAHSKHGMLTLISCIIVNKSCHLYWVVLVLNMRHLVGNCRPLAAGCICRFVFSFFVK